MIQANELRIGNWIADRGGKMWQIDSWEYKTKVCAKPPSLGVIEPFGEMFGHPFTEEIQYLQPIPLNPEILEKCGFEKIDEEYVLNTKPVLKWVEGNDNDWFIIFQMDYGCDWQSVYHVRTLHQLQNLYFAFTGEELNVNL